MNSKGYALILPREKGCPEVGVHQVDRFAEMLVDGQPLFT
jgi:hypothetical protein